MARGLETQPDNAVSVPGRLRVCLLEPSRGVVPLPRFPNALVQLPHLMPVAKGGSSSGSRETKGKVAIVTEAKETGSSSCSPESLSPGEPVELPWATQALPAVGRAGSVPSTQFVC